MYALRGRDQPQTVGRCPLAQYGIQCQELADTRRADTEGEEVFDGELVNA
jgi:hypothetical protein